METPKIDKQGLLVCKGTWKEKNIGDYIQSLASAIFLDEVDDYIEREELGVYHQEESIKVILHGWFMHKPQMWPPSQNIIPLITSFHIVPRVAEQLLAGGGLEYFKKHEPIGCRDLGTLELLQSKGVEAYYSSCLTLVLGARYKSTQQSDEVIFVDPYFQYLRNRDRRFSPKNLVTACLSLCKNYRKVSAISRNIRVESESRKLASLFPSLDRMLSAAAFYHTYSSFFEDEILLNATFRVHCVSQREYQTEESKFQLARDLMHDYAQAKLVVTSRIHCALPCLAVETPVIFVESQNLNSSKKAIRSLGRFGGISNLFRCLTFENNKLTLACTDDFLGAYKHQVARISRGFNKPDYQVYRDELYRQCSEFMSPASGKLD